MLDCENAVIGAGEGDFEMEERSSSRVEAVSCTSRATKLAKDSLSPSNGEAESLRPATMDAVSAIIVVVVAAVVEGGTGVGVVEGAELVPVCIIDIHVARSCANAQVPSYTIVLEINFGGCFDKCS